MWARSVLLLGLSLALQSCPERDRSTVAPATWGDGFTELVALSQAPFPADATLRDQEQPAPTFGVIGDVDGDGLPEVILTPQPEFGSAVFYTYDAPSGRLVRSPLRLPAGARSVIAAMDVDGDGVPDLVTADAGRELVYGLGRGVFSLPAGLDPGPEALERGGHLTGIHFDDVDQDGWLDVIVAGPRCCLGCRSPMLYLRDGLRSYANRTELLPSTPYGGASYGVFAAEMGGGELTLVDFASNCGNSIAPMFYRVSERDSDGYPRFEAYDPTPADAFFRHGNGALSPALFAPMAAAATDVDGDGLLDLVVSFDAFQALFSGSGDGRLIDRGGRSGMAFSASDLGRPQVPWGIAFLDLDQDGRADVVATHGNDYGRWLGMANDVVGPQYVTAHRNEGAFYFADVTESLNLGRRGQWMSLAVGDLELDGDADLVVGGQGEVPRVYRNDIESGNHGFSLRLRGTTSNHLGIGARVSVLVRPGLPEQRHVVGGLGSPLVFSDPTVFVGLGAARLAERVRVVWPSGTVQDVYGLHAGTQHLLDEPALFLVEPRERRVPADGRSVARVRITPRALGGAARAAERVTVRRAYGAEALVRPLERDADAWVATVVAPTRTGSTVLAITVDGVESRIRPRLWWTAVRP